MYFGKFPALRVMIQLGFSRSEPLPLFQPCWLRKNTQWPVFDIAQTDGRVLDLLRPPPFSMRFSPAITWNPSMPGLLTSNRIS